MLTKKFVFEVAAEATVMDFNHFKLPKNTQESNPTFSDEKQKWRS